MLALWTGRDAVLQVLPASDVTDMERRNPDLRLRADAAVNVGEYREDACRSKEGGGGDWTLIVGVFSLHACREL